ncbi:MAG: efflux RND transporter periplasmic adaptor subunit [Vicinamibacterales bacterium]
MTSLDTRASNAPSSVSLRMLFFAIGASVLFTGFGSWFLLRPDAPSVGAAVEEPQALAGPISLSPEAQRNAGIELAPVAAQPIATEVELTGVVSADETRVAHVRPLARGVVERAWVQPGDRVKKGQPLATYDNIQLGELVGDYLTARAGLRQTESDLAVKHKVVDRSRELIKLEAIARQTLDLREAELEAAEAAVARDRAAVARVEEQLHRFGMTDDDLDRLTAANGTSPHRNGSLAVLRAPFDGIVTRYGATEGEVTEPDRELFTISDLSVVWVLADVYEADITRIRAGSEARVRVDAYPDRTFVGRVTYVADILDPQTRTAKARVIVDNPDAALKLDMFARLRVATIDSKPRVVVPASAVQTIDNKSVVFVAVGQDRFIRRDIEPGTTSRDVVEIRSGLQPGETVVANGTFYLKTALLQDRIGDEH